MSDSEEVIPEKKGRGRPPADKSDMVNSNLPITMLLRIIKLKYFQKRKAEADKSDAPPAKKGRGRPKGSTKKTPPKKAEPKAKAPRKTKKKSSSEEESEDSSS